MSGDLPPGWMLVPLSDVTDRVQNASPEDEPQREFGYVDISAIDNTAFTITASEVKHFRGNEAPSRARRPIEPNDVLFSNVRTYLRNIALVENDCPADLCSTGFTVLRPNAAVDPRYLFRYVLTDDFIERVTPQQTGTHYPATSDRVVMAEAIPLAPLPEQRRIVAQVELLLAKARASQERLDKIPLLVKRFRQSVLSAACDGRLTADWREKQGVAVDDGEETEGDLPPSWSKVEFGSLIGDGPQNGLYKPSSFYGQGTLIVRIDAFYDGEITAWSDLKRLRVTDKEERQFGLRDGDILINRVNSPKFLGKAGLVRGLTEPCVYESNMMRLRLNDSAVSPEYAIIYLQCGEGVTELRKNAKHAVNQSSINQEDVKAVLFNLPPLMEQREIVRRVQTLLVLADRLQARYEKARAQIDKLTQSVLAKAFRGELVPTEAELARREGREYETAEELLDRIRAASSVQHGGARRKRSARGR